jgi:excinuclease UvrABC nuclease subunit
MIILKSHMDFMVHIMLERLNKIHPSLNVNLHLKLHALYLLAAFKECPSILMFRSSGRRQETYFGPSHLMLS